MTFTCHSCGTDYGDPDENEPIPWVTYWVDDVPVKCCREKCHPVVKHAIARAIHTIMEKNGLTLYQNGVPEQFEGPVFDDIADDHEAATNLWRCFQRTFGEFLYNVFDSWCNQVERVYYFCKDRGILR